MGEPDRMVMTPNFAFAGGGVQAGRAEAVAARVDARSASEKCILDKSMSIYGKN